MMKKTVCDSRQDCVGCSVPLCEAQWCDRERKTTCALRKFYLLEVKRLRGNRDMVARFLGAESASKYAKRYFYWGNYKHGSRSRRMYVYGKTG